MSALKSSADTGGLLLWTHCAQWKVPGGGSLRSSSYSWWMPERWSLPRCVSSSCGRIDSGPGTWMEASSTGIPTSSSTGSTRPFWPASSCWFQLYASNGSRPPRCCGRQSLGRCWRSSAIFTIWTWSEKEEDPPQCKYQKQRRRQLVLFVTVSHQVTPSLWRSTLIKFFCDSNVAAWSTLVIEALTSQE